MSADTKQLAFDIEEHASYELLVDFYDGMIDENNSEAINSHLANCDRCHAIYDGVQLIRGATGGQAHDGSEFLEEVRQKQQQTIGSQSIQKHIPDSTFPWKTALAIAASLSILVLIAWPFLFSGRENTDAMVQSYLEEGYRPPTIDRGSNLEASDLERALAFYSEQNYAGALPYFEQVIKTENNNNEALFYAGLCYLLLEKSEINKAIQTFEKVIAGQSRYNEQSKWFQSLAYYLSGEREEAKAILKTIVEDSSHFKFEEASELLQAL